jgi:hypothetical protein
MIVSAISIVSMLTDIDQITIRDTCPLAVKKNTLASLPGCDLLIEYCGRLAEQRRDLVEVLPAEFVVGFIVQARDLQESLRWSLENRFGQVNVENRRLRAERALRQRLDSWNSWKESGSSCEFVLPASCA